MGFVKRIRRWRLHRAYRTIARVEVHLAEEAGRLRLAFAEETIKRADAILTRSGVSRSERRRWTREFGRG